MNSVGIPYAPGFIASKLIPAPKAPNPKPSEEPKASKWRDGSMVMAGLKSISGMANEDGGSIFSIAGELTAHMSFTCAQLGAEPFEAESEVELESSIEISLEDEECWAELWRSKLRGSEGS
jgi:hypothetical protein